ncbi:MAG: hypothetical protein ACXVDD_05250 [Polyangia bacterium]
MNRTWGTFTSLVVAGALAGCTGAAPGAARDPLLTRAATGNFAIVGVTADNFAIVTDNTTHATNAVNLQSGAVQTITSGTLSAGQPQWIVGSTVVLGHDATADGAGQQLTAWSAATGSKLLSANATGDLWNGLRLSADGQHIAYWDHVDTATDALTVDTPAHDAPRVLIKVSSACAGGVRVAPTAPLRVVASYCTLPPAGADSDRVVTAFNLASNTSVALQPTAAGLGFRLDPLGQRALVRTMGVASLVSLDGTQRSPVDSAIIGALFFNDGVELAYATADGALKRICNTGVPDVVVPAGVAGLYWMTPDNTALMYYTNQDATSGNSDLVLASTVAAGPPLVLEADGSGHPEAFSADSKHALFYQGVDGTGHVGTFTTMPTAGGPGRVLSMGQSVVDGDWELSNDKVVFNDHWTAATATVPEHVALEVVDLAGSAAPKQLVASAEALFAVTADNGTLVFTTNDPAAPGLYTVAIP